jgi:uncharacterized protein YndB with AHSA1/START domain
MAEAELARFIDHWTIEFVRTYPHPIERVWKAITDPAEVAIWFIPPTVWEPTPGGRYQFEEGFAGVVQALEPMRTIRFGPKPDGGPWPGAGSYFQFELQAVAGGTLLRFVQHADPDSPDPGELREGLASPGRPGALAGWHHAFEELGELLDGAPIGARLPPTRLTDIVRNWAAMDMSAEFTAAQKSRILKGLRAREFHFELTDTYTGHVRATRPPAPIRSGASTA